MLAGGSALLVLLACLSPSVADVGIQPLPAQAKKGEKAFLEVADKTANKEEGGTWEQQLNVLQMPRLSKYWAAWEWKDRPRKVALIMDDMEKEYIPYVGPIIPNCELLLKAFRAAGLPVFWSVWWRFGPDDGYFNTMDRFYGPKSWNTSTNALYIHSKDGADVIPSLSPQTDLEWDRFMHKSYSLDIFDEHSVAWVTGKLTGTLHDELQKLGVDTVIGVGAWTDDCVLSAAFHAFSLQYDVIVVEDAVSTASLAHFAALDVMRGSVAKVMKAADIVSLIAPEVLSAAGDAPAQKVASSLELAAWQKPPPLALQHQAPQMTEAAHPQQLGGVVDEAAVPGGDAAWLQMVQFVFMCSFGPACFAMGWLLRGRVSKRDPLPNTFYAI
mmetsp:Transcript_38807/g.91262  ORF Transcript_38807/g.91262 Transcript_38807/m.91262 type:complete len:384 (-) Transcript_38807:69-1220(-)